MRAFSSIAVHCLLIMSACATFAQQGPDIGKLSASLASKDEKQRAAAADELARLGPRAKDAVPGLVKALSDDAKSIRWRAARALGAQGAAASPAVKDLTTALQDSDPFVRAHAAHALGTIGQPAQAVAPELIKIAADEDPMVRRAVLGALRRLKSPPEVTTPVLIKLLENESSEAILAMISTLTEGGEAVVPELTKALANPRTVYWAALALTEIGPKAGKAVLPLAEVLKKSEDPEVRMQAALALAAIGPGARAATPALSAALEKDEFSNVRWAAAFALGQSGATAEAASALENSVRGDDPFLAMISAMSLARLDPDNKERVQTAVKLVVEGLQSKEAHHRSAAARALVDIKGAPELVVPALVGALADSSLEVAGNALEALSGGGESVAATVSVGLQNKKLRKMSLRVLSRIGPEAKVAVPELTKALADDSDSDFKREVQFTLGTIGAPAAPAVPELVRSLSSEDENVRNSAIYALGKIGPAAKDALPALQRIIVGKDATLKWSGLWAALKIDPTNPRLTELAVPAFIEGLAHERELVRYESAVSLSEMGVAAKPAAAALKRALEDENSWVREAAAEALKNLAM